MDGNKGIPMSIYLSKVNSELVFPIDYGKWINFQESYPPLAPEPYHGTTIEILHQGDPYFNDVFHDGNRVHLRRYDWHMDLLEYEDPEYTNDYWRFVPDPPGNEGYDVG